MNPDLNWLQPYPFERLATLKGGVQAPSDRPHIALSIGEPQHPTPNLLKQSLIDNLGELSKYPTTVGLPDLREAIAAWATRRFNLPASSLDPGRHVLPIAGSREALFAIAQTVIDRSSKPVVITPNPFYQIYEGAAYLSGAEPYFVNATEDNGYTPDYRAIPEAIWARCQLIYLCSPNNPTGTTLDLDTLRFVLGKADQYGFVVAQDECYSELYFDEQHPPLGLLDACIRLGRDDFRHCLVFHSLSKRSNAPSLRSGFVAGDAAVVERFLLYRTYHGCAMSLPTQLASITAWRDEKHVLNNRDLYRAKFAAVIDILRPTLDAIQPEAGFYLWTKTPIADTDFARDLFAHENVTVLPGSFLSRTAHGINPGTDHVRMALVATLDNCLEAAERIRRFTASL